MSILDNFKKTIGGKKEGEEKKAEAKEKVVEAKKEVVEKKVVEKAKTEKPEKKIKKEASSKKKGKSIFGGNKKKEKEDIPAERYGVLKSPHLTERATDLAKENKYIFKVAADANKIQIRKAIEDLYGVSVTKVNVINVPRKAVRLGRSQGFKTGYRKAIVAVKEGERIELVESP